MFHANLGVGGCAVVRGLDTTRPVEFEDDFDSFDVFLRVGIPPANKPASGGPFDAAVSFAADGIAGGFPSPARAPLPDDMTPPPTVGALLSSMVSHEHGRQHTCYSFLQLPSFRYIA